MAEDLPSSNLVTKLRGWNGNSFGPYKSPVPDLLEAAAEIERLTEELQCLKDAYHANGWPGPDGTTLEGENKRLRGALEEIANVLPHDGHTAWTGWIGQMDRIARKALGSFFQRSATPGLFLSSLS